VGFLPSTGPLKHLHLPTDIRVDNGVEQGGEVTGFYDPMIAKLIVHASSRVAAARKLAAACAAVEVWPVRTNAAFLARVADDAAFIAGDIDTGFIERRAETLIPALEPSEDVVRAAAGALLTHRAQPNAGAPTGHSAPVGYGATSPWGGLSGFRSNAAPYLKVDVAVGDRAYFVAVDPALPLPSIASIDGEQVLFRRGEAWSFGPPSSVRAAGVAAVSDGAMRSPMPGRIVSVAVTEGQAVTKGQTLLALEAMKMEHALVAPFAGTVAELAVSVGDQVAENVTLVRVVAEAAAPGK
jgi:3-methylcrotonyl-CoA carboxylase alpha subunit